ncbi:hypothetical protein RvY_10334-2 [Ramazzottius varieornatus]|uniref:Uncharacterized protein n=1 Tax=Ramazzottius varieornatus TaxID=947166 RepID=A0A1D1VEI3_RAMVA|nr:hypothetical protein RvY_10334-2 [Ramazzottius varieornatus]
MGRPKITSDQLDDTIRHLSHHCQARDWSAGRIIKVALDCEESLTGKRPKLSERTVQRRLKAWSARIVTPVKNPLTYHRTMHVIWALDILDRLKTDKNHLNYVAFSDEASAKFDCDRHTVSLDVMLHCTMENSLFRKWFLCSDSIVFRREPL